MNTYRKLTILAKMLEFLPALPAAKASDWDQATKLTFSNSIQIPGRILPAGTYWFMVVDANNPPNVVQIFNSDRSIMYGTFRTINAETLTPPGKTAITFAARGPMQPEAI